MRDLQNFYKSNVTITWDIETVPDKYSKDMESYQIKRILDIKDDVELSLDNLKFIDTKEAELAGLKKEFYKRISLNPITARIACIGVKVNNKPTRILSEWEDKSEIEIIKKFWSGINTLYQKHKQNPLFVTKNGKGFDVQFIIVRSIIHQVAPPSWFKPGIYLRRYSYAPHFDIQEAFSNYNNCMYLPLNLMLESLGIEYQNSYGKEVKNFYDNGEFKRIEEHCISDVEGTYKLFTKCWELIDW